MFKTYCKVCNAIEDAWYSRVIDRADRWMKRHPRVSKFFAWDDLVEDDKKAPAVAAAEVSKPNQKIIYLSLARQQPKRKAVSNHD